MPSKPIKKNPPSPRPRRFLDRHQTETKPYSEAFPHMSWLDMVAATKAKVS